MSEIKGCVYVAVENVSGHEILHEFEAMIESNVLTQPVPISCAVVVNTSHCKGISGEEHPYILPFHQQASVVVCLPGKVISRHFEFIPHPGNSVLRGIINVELNWRYAWNSISSGIFYHFSNAGIRVYGTFEGFLKLQNCIYVIIMIVCDP